MHIHHLHLYTAAFEEQFRFYSQVLEIPVLERDTTFFTLTLGQSTLTFHQSSAQNYYHFACNIPSFQSQEALSWLKERVEILTDAGKEIIEFSNWNAETIYFKDAGGNIVEFIARKNLKLETQQPFSPQSLYNISEIGLPVQSTEETFRYINEVLENSKGQPLATYSTVGKEFLAVGDENGLFIIVDEATKIWYPTDIPARAFPLHVIFQAGGNTFQLFLNAEQIKVERQNS